MLDNANQKGIFNPESSILHKFEMLSELYYLKLSYERIPLSMKITKLFKLDSNYK